MRLVLERYVFKEVAIPFVLSVLVMMILMLIQRMILITEWIVNRGVPIIHVAQLLGLMMPFFFTVVTPVALLFATLLAINRMSADSEITAMKASGISVARLFAPVMSVGVVCMMVTAVMTLWAIPAATRYTDELKYELAKSSARAGIVVKGFVKMGSLNTLYVDAIEDEKLKGVMLARIASEKKNVEGPNTIFVFAKEGTIKADPDELISYLHLKDGEIQTADYDGTVFRRITFGSFDVKIDLTEKEKDEDLERGSEFEIMDLPTLAERKKEIEKEMDEYKENTPRDEKVRKSVVKRYKVALRQIDISRHQKFSLPVACLILALWGIPLGIQPPRSTRHQGVITSIGLTLVYYVMVSGGKILAVKGQMPVPMAIWGPNAVVVLTGVYFMFRVSNDKPLPLSAALGRLEEIVKRIAGRFRKGGAS